MDMSLFPEHHRAYVLSGIVRNNRNGIAVRLGGLEGENLHLIVRPADPAISLPDHELREMARSHFGDLPYELSIYTE